jgi:hypothetical protein
LAPVSPWTIILASLPRCCSEHVVKTRQVLVVCLEVRRYS